MFDLNAPAALGFLVYDATKTLANATQVTVTITKPDGTVVGPTVVAPTSTGTYNYTGPSDQAGRYGVYWQATGTNFTAKADQYDVRSSAALGLLSLADAKAALNIDATDYTDDDEIRDKIDAVTDLMERRIGVILPRQITETVIGANGMWALNFTPIISLTSITPKQSNLPSYVPTDLAFKESAGTVWAIGGYDLYSGPYQIVYQSGRTGVIPARFLEAARLLLSHLWDTQRSGDRPGMSIEDVLKSNEGTQRLLETLRDDITPGFS